MFRCLISSLFSPVLKIPQKTFQSIIFMIELGHRRRGSEVMNAQKCEFQREEDKSRRLVTVLMPPTHEVNWAIFTYSVLRFFLDE